MRSLVRPLVRLGILFLVVRIVADIATPFSPGAFGLDPSSVLAAEVKPDDTAAPSPAVLPGRPQWADDVHVAPQRRAPRPSPRVRLFLPCIVHLSDSGSPPVPEDH